ncbi:hypothetical protein F503_07630 [Ophiostoma piceae UAMH 11346]|uniref:Uncharacterized protein n=1 Tax=Ophiostoma piceae (strain UAMH 11346) TaxID=1262450 RepID=S3BSC3_OPHP1|nr:hypothetical protein F503_07630 [Ophiostoma piceae UAMH 11346]
MGRNQKPKQKPGKGRTAKKPQNRWDRRNQPEGEDPRLAGSELGADTQSAQQKEPAVPTQTVPDQTLSAGVNTTLNNTASQGPQKNGPQPGQSRQPSPTTPAGCTGRSAGS